MLAPIGVAVLGRNFGDGHMHNECLIDALRQRQEYRLVDAATGECERGYCDVADMVVNQRWADDIPVYVLSDRVSGS